MPNKGYIGVMSYEEYIIQTHLDIRKAIEAYKMLPDLIPAQVKKDLWQGIVEALNLVQNEMAKLPA